MLLGIPATVLLLIQAVTRDDALLPYSSAFEAVLYFYAAGALIAYMLADHVITRDELFAVGATFTSSPGRSPTPTPSARRSSPAASRRPSTLRRTQLDRAALPELPRPCRARGWATWSDQALCPQHVMIEQVAGLAYVAMVVSRLVRLLVHRPRVD